METDSRDLYIDLVKRSLMNLPYLENEYSPIMPRGLHRRVVLAACQRLGVALCHARRPVLEERLQGKGHTSVAHTMVSLSRLDNLESCVKSVLEDDVPGDFIETGVLRGGCSILMRAILNAYRVTDRTVWLADSFRGLPPPNSKQYPADRGANWHTFLGGDVSLESVKRTFDRYGLLDDKVAFLQGWFRDTLPSAPIDRLAVLRMDGDMYESTMDALGNLYPKLSVGGYAIVDDYYLEPTRRAVHDYRAKHGIRDEIIDIDGAGAYWRRGA